MARFSVSFQDWLHNQKLMARLFLHEFSGLTAYQVFFSHITKTLPVQMCRKFHLQKTEKFQIKTSDIFQISSQNIDCGYLLELPLQGSSNEYPQSMFWAEIRKIMYTPVNPRFTI